MKKLFSVLIALMALSVWVAPAIAEDPFCGRNHRWTGNQDFKNVDVRGTLSVTGPVSGLNKHSNVFYVDSGSGQDTVGNDNGKTWNKAFATINYALDQCTANNGDVIYVMPGHARNMDDADEIDVDVAGVYIIGLGSDADMPTFTYTDTDGEFVIGAANVTVHNLRFVAGISGVTMGISIEAAGDNAKISNCDFPESGTSTYEFTDGIDLASGADGVIITGCEYYNADNTGAAHFIEMGNGVNNDIEISNNVIYGEFSVSAIWSDTVDLEVLIKDNVITNLTSDQHAIEFTGAATGTICGNKIYTNAEGTSIDPGSMKCIENYVTTTTDASGMLYPAVDDGVAQLNATTIAKIMGDGVTYTNPNYLTVSADCTNATWKSIAAHEIAVVTGTVRMWIVVEATSGVSSAAEGAHISLGCAGNTAEVIAATDAHLFAAGDVWGGTTPSVGMETSLDVIHDFVVVNGTDVGYTVADEALTAGTMVFHIWWVPLSSTGAVTAGAGGAF